MAQTSYSTNMGKGLAGQLVGVGDSRRVVTRRAEAAIAFGLGVIKGTAADQVKVPAAGAVEADFRGIALHVHNVEMDASGNAGYAADDATNVLRQGVVYVTAEEAVTPNDSVYMRIVSGAGGTVPGQFRNDADTASAIALTRCRFLESAGAGELVALEVSLP